MDSTNKLRDYENKIFDSSTIDSLPFEFYNFIANVISNPNKAREIVPPIEAEEFFKINKKKDAAILFQYLYSNGIAKGTNSFMESYRELLLKRYLIAYRNNARFSLRRIQTPEEYGFYNTMKVKNIPGKHYFTLSIDSYVRTLPNGDLDITKLIEDENREGNIATLFSIMTSLPDLATLLGKHFEEFTSRGFFPRVFRYELADLIYELSDELLYYFSKLVYKSIKQGIDLKETKANLLDYYSKFINPDKFKFSADLEPLQEKLHEISVKHLSKMKELTKNSKEEIYYEILETILIIIENGFAIPSFFYDVEIRKASRLDSHDYKVKYVADVYLYDEKDKLSKIMYESYGIVMERVNIKKIITETLGNKKLYNKLISYGK